MAKRSFSLTMAGLSLRPASPRPLFQQLCEELRRAVLDGRLNSGARLPASRMLATDLGVSRQTVSKAFEQLIIEGYLVGKIGSGTFVNPALPDDLLRARGRAKLLRQRVPLKRLLSARGAQLIEPKLFTFPPTAHQLRAFYPGMPAVDEFPFHIWSRLVGRRWHYPRRDLFAYGDAAGYQPLREAIAMYLRSVRAVRCSAEQVIIVAGSQQGLHMAAWLLLDRGDAVWVEDPCYPGARVAFASSGAEIIPVPVDGQGLDVDVGVSTCHAARMAFVTPSFQYPSGVTLSLARRLALLDWARRSDAWIIEDDYDSEFQYSGSPLPSLQGLDDHERVIYLGTFSKVLFPALRLGYLIVPPPLVEAFTRMQAMIGRHVPTLDQVVLADFFESGYFARHVRRMQILYAERQAALLDASSKALKTWLRLQPTSAGMHLLGQLPDKFSDTAVAHAAVSRGVHVHPLSRYYLGPSKHNAILLGYPVVNVPAIYEGVRHLRSAFDVLEASVCANHRARPQPD